MKEQIFEEINARIRLLDALIKKADLQMPDVDGSLRVSCNGSNPKYYHLREKGDRKGAYIRKNDVQIIRDLAQKGYNKQMIALAEEERRILKGFIEEYPEMTFEECWDKLPKARKTMIDPIWISDEEYVKKWLSQDYERKGFGIDDPAGLVSDSGIRVRSKSEINIANALEKHKVPFIYELPRTLKGFGRVYPDFTIMDVKARKIIIWEHHGLMDDDDYRENNFLRKNNAYIANGFFPGKNLIQTFESQRTPLGTTVIESIIREYLHGCFED